MGKFKDGDKCSICGREWEKGKRFIHHHVSYEPEITTVVCYSCHSWMHGSAPVYGHPFKAKGNDVNERADAPIRFARKVVEMYEEGT